AFVAGLSLEHIENKNFKIGAEYFELIFGSVFFVSLGILTNLKLVFSNINFIIVLTLAAIFSKFFGTYIGSRLSRINNKASEVISVGMIPIGEIAAITALIALNKGIFDSSIYSSVIFVGIITAIYSPVVLKKILGIQIQTKKAFNFKIKHKVSLH
ncbi:cation:proton antiporter, partial [Candidatus Woesearchaeota archaeon]|nr:cation:proton antiporter [Candidatus Woesearchaeota archaeon]